MSLRFFSLGVVILLVCHTGAAQPYTGGRHTRHRFAQMNIGVDCRSMLPGGSYSYRLTGASLPERFVPGPTTETRVVIGGTHFWGHADFYIAIPVYAKGHGTSTGVETGARLYPWAITSGKVRPYAGISILPVNYIQDNGPQLIKMRTPASCGLTFSARRHLFDAGLTWFYRSGIRYYISPTTEISVQQPALGVAIGYKVMLETTISAERAWLNGTTRTLTDTLAKRKKLNGLTLAAGPSSSFFIRKPGPTGSIPYLGNHTASGIFADLGLGYYWHGADLQLNVAWRRYGSNTTAFGTEQRVGRQSIALECYKFFADYHGFVPFAGVALSREQLTMTETVNGNTIAYVSRKDVSPGLTLGWDIRPDRLQSFYLRTNMRYFPALNVAMPSATPIPMDALEVNFIQLVVFPGRLARRHR